MESSLPTIQESEEGPNIFSEAPLLNVAPGSNSVPTLIPDQAVDDLSQHLSTVTVSSALTEQVPDMGSEPNFHSPEPIFNGAPAVISDQQVEGVSPNQVTTIASSPRSYLEAEKLPEIVSEPAEQDIYDIPTLIYDQPVEDLFSTFYLLENCVHPTPTTHLSVARDKENGDLVVIRTVYTEILDGCMIPAAVREISCMKEVEHENLARYLGSFFDIEAQKLSIVFSFMEGNTLEDVIKAFAPLEEHLIAAVMVQVRCPTIPRCISPHPIT